MKKLYKCTFKFTDPEYRSTRASTIFLERETRKEASDVSELAFRSNLIKAGIPRANYTIEVQESTDNEVAEYKLKMRLRDGGVLN